MSREVTVKISCNGDNCSHSTNKERDSGWIMAGLGNGVFVVGKTKALVVDHVTPGSNLYDFCGEQCAIKWISKQLSQLGE